ncbi:hypothetical protein ACSQ67_011611 [Phaseolus vulgaris]
MYKTKLQELCHKRKWGLPRYSAMKDGPNHIPRFKASVYVNGVIFTSSSASTSLKEAKNQAAMVAFLGLSSGLEVGNSCYLQNNAPMNNLDPPVFELPPANDFKATELANGCSIECPSSSNTIKETEGAFDLMSLSSDIFDKAKGVEFHGKGCRSKKEAEEDAANIAYIALKECGLSMYAVFSPSQIEHKAEQSILNSDIVKCLQNLKLEDELLVLDLNETLLANAKVSNEEVPKSSFLQSPDEQMMNNRSLSSVNQYPVLPQNHLHFTD